MFARKVQSAIWNDDRWGGDPKRSFTSTLIFDDGFPSQEDLLGYMASRDLPLERFVVVQFCDMWYAVNFVNNFTHILVTGERVWYMTNCNQPKPDVVPADELKAGDLEVPELVATDRPWQDGLIRSVEMIDIGTRLTQVRAGKEQPVLYDSLIWNHTLFLLAMHFFASPICIRDNDYTEHVLSAYFNDRSIRAMVPTIFGLRKQGIEYWNPFTLETCRNYNEKKKLEKEKLGDLDPGQEIKKSTKQDAVPGPYKMLRAREQYPCRELSHAGSPAEMRRPRKFI